MAECKECGDEVEQLVTVKAKGKSRRVCEECADKMREEGEIAEAAEGVVQGMMEYKGGAEVPNDGTSVADQTNHEEEHMGWNPTQFKAKDYAGLKGLTDITDDQIAEHLKLYNGYVTRANKLSETIAAMVAEGKAATPEYQELKRRAGWEHNGVLLHEYYFDNLKAGGGSPEGTKFHDAVAKQFGSFDTWKTDFLGVGKMPGVGWAVTYFDPARGTFDNYWIDRHDVGHPAGQKPVLVMDLWEHAWSAYLKPTERAKYLEHFYANVCWKTVSGRL